MGNMVYKLGTVERITVRIWTVTFPFFPMLRLITDCDGPIMDVSERYHQVYQYCLEQVKLPGQNLNILSKAEFWQRKRSKVPKAQIGLDSGLTPEQTEEFVAIRNRTVHSQPYLPYDQPLAGVEEILQGIKDRGIDLVLMTMRRESELQEALDRNHFNHFFPIDCRYCLADGYVKTGDTNDKPLLMERALAELPPADSVWMVGDTEADILAAQRGNMPAIAVLSGIRNREQLERYQPDFIVNNLAEAVNLFYQHHGVE
ncbi:HAD family hydrolase [Synechocystis sp. LEGE 06083]|nr:HAD family hydrolase [Synechocystis sp. LEGE 06083]